MRFVIEFVLAAGLLGLSGVALIFLLRLMLLTWLVQVVAQALQGMLSLIKSFLSAIIFVLVPAALGGFIVGITLQIVMNLASLSAGGESANPTMPLLVAFLTFFVIVATRTWRWKASRGCQNIVTPEVALDGAGAVTPSETVCYLPGYEAVANAWKRAVMLAPERRADLADAEANCATLLHLFGRHDGVLDSGISETAMLIRKHLASLIDGTERRLRGASSSVRSAAIDEMVTLLLGFAQRARQDLQAFGPSKEEEDKALRAHLAAQLFS
jgi:hypothetical protein